MLLPRHLSPGRETNIDKLIEYSRVLKSERPVQTYSDETVAAEKLEALVFRGTVNSRYKDLYELLIEAELNDESVITAASNTFNNNQLKITKTDRHTVFLCPYYYLC